MTRALVLAAAALFMLVCLVMSMVTLPASNNTMSPADWVTYLFNALLSVFLIIFSSWMACGSYQSHLEQKRMVNDPSKEPYPGEDED